MTTPYIPLAPRIVSCAHCRLNFTRVGFTMHTQRCPSRTQPPLFDRRGAPFSEVR